MGDTYRIREYFNLLIYLFSLTMACIKESELIFVLIINICYATAYNHRILFIFLILTKRIPRGTENSMQVLSENVILFPLIFKLHIMFIYDRRKENRSKYT